MSIIPFPEVVINKIIDMCRNFLWSSKHAPVAWKSVCKPSECGGLGLRNLHYWNRALLCKLLWNIHIKKDTLWIKWVNHYYSTDFWNYTGRTEDSTLLKSLIKLRNELSLNDDSSETLIQRLQHWFEGSNASVDHAYRWFFRNEMQWPWKTILYKPGTLPKHKFALWMFSHRKFLTRDRQPYIEDKRCVLCGMHNESFAHLFCKCTITKVLWDRIKECLGLRKVMGSANALLRAFRGLYRGSTAVHKNRIATIAATIYHIWDIRNRKIFDDENPNLNAVSEESKLLITRYIPEEHMTLLEEHMKQDFSNTNRVVIST